MKRQITFAVVILTLLIAAGVGLTRSSFVSFKHIGPPAPDAATAAAEAALPAKITFNEHIGPILSENCYYCHGQDATARQADLRVDRPEFAFAPRKNGLPPIVKGHPESSALIARITSKDPNQIMPPPSSRKTLTPEQIALLTKWVRNNANYEEHWSFVKPERGTPPAVKQTGWVKNPIDNFVLAKLEKNGLAPESEADPRTLLRRVTLDLTGLPPTPEEADAFAADKSPDAYEKAVDRLLANPHYGEHEARYWLDAARYAETVGLHFDEPTSIFPYRDYVIKAFNDNKPFDRFTVEQVAGDLLPNATLEQKVATGFTRCGISTSEGGSIEAELLAGYAKEAVETNSATFMGLTMGCCSCHDHKFDPVSQKDFYAFSAFFRNTTQKGIGPRNAAAVPPFIRVPAKEDEPRWNIVSKQMDTAKAAADAYLASTGLDKKLNAPVLLQKLAARPPTPPVSTEGLELHLPLREGAGNEIKSVQGVSYKLTGKPEWSSNGLTGAAPNFDSTDYAELGNIGDFDTTDAFSYGVWVRVASHTSSGAIFARMDRNNNERGWDLYLDHGRPTVHLINFWPRNAIKQVALKTLTAGPWQHVFVTYDGSSKAAGLKIYVDGELQSAKPEEDSLTESIRSPAQFTLGKRSGGEGAFPVGLQDLRVYRRVLAPEEVKALCGSELLPIICATAPDKLSESQRKWATNFLLKDDPKMVRLQAAVDGLKGEYDALVERSPATMVMNDKPTPAFAYVLKRGQYDQLGEKVATGRSQSVAAAASGRAAQPPGSRAVDGRSGQPAAGARDGQPFLAAVLRGGHRAHGGGFRHHGRAPGQPAIARLAGGRFSRIRLGREARAPTDGDERGLSAIGPHHPAEARKRPGKPPRFAGSALPDGRRDDSRPGARGERIARADHRWPQREALPAGRPVGSRQHDQGILQAGQGRRPAPAQHVYLLEAART